MKYKIIGNTGIVPKIAILCPRIQTNEITNHYYNPYLNQLDQDVMVCDLFLDKTKKKTKASEIKEYLNDLLPNLLEANIELLIITHSDYFKVITKSKKTDATIGDVLPTIIDGIKATYCPNYSRVFYDPVKIKNKIKLSLESVVRWFNGDTSKLGSRIVKYRAYPKTNKEIIEWLDKLYEMDCDLTCDTENFSLKHYDSGLGTITFCWGLHEGVAFPIDYMSLGNSDNKQKGKCIRNNELREALISFFKKFKRKMIYHNICYDVYILIYQLFMKDILDQKGLLEGLDVLLNNWECTQLLTYLATNSCAGNELGLKVQAQEYAGNYAKEDIKDISLIPLDELLEYNLIDGLSTWFVYNKHKPTVIQDNQLDIYQNIFTPAVKDIIQMQLSGLPINIKKVKKLNSNLTNKSNDLIKGMNQNKVINTFLNIIQNEYVTSKNESYKKKIITVDDIPEGVVKFNPNSPVQLQRLLFSEDFFGLPILKYTDKKSPSVDADTIEKLIIHTQDQDIIDFLNLLIEYKALDTILSTFIPAFLRSQKGPDGWNYLFGNFKLGGTVSGRLSSNSPNLQNIPSTGSSEIKAKLAKLIKECVEAPKGWLFVGLDFDSLEDKISAVTTKDPKKIQVYKDKYDGHCLRAYAYFGNQMIGIDPNCSKSINSIKTKYPSLRQDSKVPTFALTYNGTYITLMKNVGLTEKQAKSIEEKYHELYKVSDQWVANKIKQASKCGYVTVAFGLRVRTPLLHQVVLGTSKTPHEAQRESRTAGNALGQSWGMLNNRAASEFMNKTRNSDYALDIKPSAHIHDAQYYMIRDDIGTLMFINKNLSKAVQWQEDELIKNDYVKMSGQLEIFHPNWSRGFDIPNDADEAKVKELVSEHLKELGS